MKTEEAINEVGKLMEGEFWIYPEGDYGRAEIWLIHNLYFLFSISTFGGTPSFEAVFSKYNIEQMIKVIEKWT